MARVRQSAAVPRPRSILLALLPLGLHGLAREVDRGLGLVLRAELEPAGLLSEVARAAAADGLAMPGRVLAWLGVGLVAWLGLGWWRARREGEPLSGALSTEAATSWPLLLRPALTLLALGAVAVEPTYPFGFTLPVALTQDLGVAQDAAVAAVLLALRLPPIRVPAPGAAAVFLVSFLGYALLTPSWAHHWDGHPGNEPKYLRMAVAIGHDLTLDAEGVSAAMEDLPVTPLGEAALSSARALARESWGMLRAVVSGGGGREDIRATRITRQTIGGKNGGVYYVLAPGPSMMLAPAFRVDRAINRARGVRGPLAVSVLAWNAVAALLVVMLFLLARDATGRPGLAATLAFGFAALPPFLFYFFQFYPEMPGALVMASAFWVLGPRPDRLARHPWLFGTLLAALPWLHQKFLPVWLALVATGLWVMWRREGLEESTARRRGHPEVAAWLRAHRRWLVAFLLPQAVGLYLTALYNFAITGSVRPDALFLAWGPGGVTSARVGQGLLGILLDARYGILPYVPLLVLGPAGLLLGGGRRFGVVLPAAAVYYLTVASADNWAGAVCNLGRYFVPVAPLAVALVAVALGRASRRRGALALAAILAAWSALFAYALWTDPHAANDSSLLLAKSTYADGNQYIPNLKIRTWAEGASGLWARVGAWLVWIGVAAAWWRRVAAAHDGGERERRGTPGRSPHAALAGTFAVLLTFAFALERWPAWRESPSHLDSLVIGTRGRVFARGVVLVRPDELVVGPGKAVLVVRTPGMVSSLPVTAGGEGVMRASGLRPFLLRPSGARLHVPLRPYHVVRGRDGRQVVFARTELSVEGQAVLRPDPVSEPEMPATEQERNRRGPDLVGT